MPEATTMKLTWVKSDSDRWTYHLHIGDKNGPIVGTQLWSLGRIEIEIENNFWVIQRASMFNFELVEKRKTGDKRLGVINKPFFGKYKLDVLTQPDRLIMHYGYYKTRWKDAAQQEAMNSVPRFSAYTPIIEINILPVGRWQNDWRILACASLYMLMGDELSDPRMRFNVLAKD